MRSIILLLPVLLFYGCAHEPALVQLDQPGSVLLLNETFEIRARLGASPVNLPINETAARYAIKASGLPTEFILIISPNLVRGTVTVPSSKSSTLIEGVSTYYGYVDQLLRAHRDLLRGRYADAQQIVERLNQKYEDTFGTLMISAQLALLSGKTEQAFKYYSRAAQLYKQSEQLNTIFKK